MLCCRIHSGSAAPMPLWCSGVWQPDAARYAATDLVHVGGDVVMMGQLIGERGLKTADVRFRCFAARSTLSPIFVPKRQGEGRSRKCTSPIRGLASQVETTH